MSSSRDTHKSGRLLKVNPVLADGILRVGGRLCHAPLAFSRKHPIILPSDHRVTRLIIEDQHRKNGHRGMANTSTQLRQTYWIMKGTATVRKVLGKRVFCRRRNAKMSSQVMSDLPAKTLTPHKPPFFLLVLISLVHLRSGKPEATSKDTAAFSLASHLGLFIWRLRTP